MTAPTAKELLAQADRLMRRRDAGVPEELPVLTDLVVEEIEIPSLEFPFNSSPPAASPRAAREPHVAAPPIPVVTAPVPAAVAPPAAAAELDYVTLDEFVLPAAEEIAPVAPVATTLTAAVLALEPAAAPASVPAPADLPPLVFETLPAKEVATEPAPTQVIAPVTAIVAEPEPAPPTRPPVAPVVVATAAVAASAAVVTTATPPAANAQALASSIPNVREQFNAQIVLKLEEIRHAVFNQVMQQIELHADGGLKHHLHESLTERLSGVVDDMIKAVIEETSLQVRDVVARAVDAEIARLREQLSRRR